MATPAPSISATAPAQPASIRPATQERRAALRPASATPACPADAKTPSGTACPRDPNPCTPDQCDGTSATCQHPAGNAGAACRAAAGVCDVAETCTGASTSCPADGFQPGTFECRA